MMPSSVIAGKCYDPFPILSPIHSPPPPLCKVYSSNHVQDPTSFMDQFQSHPTGSLGPHPIASELMARTPVGTASHNLRDVAAFQDYVIIM